MTGYALRRLALFVPTLFLASVAVFLMLRIIPGDVASAILRDDATEEAVAILREELGLNRPLIVQYGDWLANALRLDLGNSLLYRGTSVAELIGDALPITLHLTVWGMLITMLLALPIGVYSALGRNAALKQAMRLFSIAGLSVPTFWLAIIVLYALIRFLGWSPQFRYVSFFDNPVANFTAFVIPATIFAYSNAAVIARMLRSQLLEIVSEDYIRTARAKGLSAARVNFRHAIPNAMLPVVTIIGSQFAAMITGLVIVERIFALPGLGTLMVTATLSSDYVVVQSLFMLIALLVLVVNLGVDLLYGWLDPRIRFS